MTLYDTIGLVLWVATILLGFLHHYIHQEKNIDFTLSS